MKGSRATGVVRPMATLTANDAASRLTEPMLDRLLKMKNKPALKALARACGCCGEGPAR